MIHIYITYSYFLRNSKHNEVVIIGKRLVFDSYLRECNCLGFGKFCVSEIHNK